MINTISKLLNYAPHNGMVIALMFFLSSLSLGISGSALEWWRSYLKKEREEAKLQCSDCQNYKQQITVLKDSKNDPKDDRKARRENKASLKEKLADHRYPLSLLFIHLFEF